MHQFRNGIYKNAQICDIVSTKEIRRFFNKTSNRFEKQIAFLRVFQGKIKRKNNEKRHFFEGEKRRFNLIFFQNRNAILLSFRPAQPSMESMHASTFRRLKAVSK